jgi:hypothetical protein
MEVASRTEQHQVSRLAPILEDLVKADSFSAVSDFRNTINNIMSVYNFTTLDELITNFDKLSSIERESIKLLGITKSNIEQLNVLFRDIEKHYARYHLDNKSSYEGMLKYLKNKVEKARTVGDTARIKKYQRITKDVLRYKKDTETLKEILIKGLTDYYQKQGYVPTEVLAKNNLKRLNSTVESLTHIEDTLHPEVKKYFKPEIEITNVNTRPTLNVATLFNLRDTSDELIQHITDAYGVLEIPNVLKTLFKDLQDNETYTFYTFYKELKELKDSDINLIIKTLDNYISSHQISPDILRRYEYLATKELREGLTDTETIEIDNLLTNIRRNSNNELKDFVSWLKEYVSNKAPVLKAEQIKAPIQIASAFDSIKSDYKIMQLNKTIQDIHYVQEVANMFNTTFTDLYVDPLNYMKNINNSINVIAKQDKKLGEQLRETTQDIFKQMLQTSYFMTEILNPIGIDILPKDLRNTYVMRMHDLLRMLGNSTEDISTVDNIMRLLIPDMENFFVKAEAAKIPRNTIIEQLIKPSIRNYVDKLIYLNDLFPNTENKFFNNINDNTISSLRAITSAVNEYVETDFKNANNAHNVLEALVDISSIAPIYYRDLLRDLTSTTERGLLENIKTKSESSILNALSDVQYVNRAANAEFQDYRFLEDIARSKVNKRYVDRFLELQKKFDTKELKSLERTEYYNLRELLKPYIIPSNVFEGKKAGRSTSDVWKQYWNNEDDNLRTIYRSNMI